MAGSSRMRSVAIAMPFLHNIVMSVLIILFNVTLASAPFAQSTDGDRQRDQSKAEARPTKGAEQPWQGSVLRFLTDSDYPPFNYYDEEGALVGFNVDLARAICLELDVQCDIEPANWDELIPSLNKNGVDAVIASLAINAKNLQRVDFTVQYFRSPARFVARANNSDIQIKPETVVDRKIGVIANTAHQAYLNDFFQTSEIIAFKDHSELRSALQGGDIDFIFGDGVGLMFWINGTEAAGCCNFAGGSFTEPKYFGDGIGIAVRKGNRRLLIALNEALEEIRGTSRYEELMLRYFPLKFY